MSGYKWVDTVNPLNLGEVPPKMLGALRSILDLLLVIGYDYNIDKITNSGAYIVYNADYGVTYVLKDDDSYINALSAYIGLNMDRLYAYETKYKYKKYKNELSDVLDGLIAKGLIYHYDICAEQGEYLKNISDSGISGYTRVCLVKESYYTKRKVLMPSKGVVLLMDKDTYIESIYIREVREEAKNYIVFTTKYYNGVEITNKVGLVLDGVLDTVVYRFEDENRVGMYIDDFLGISKNDSLKYTVISPYYWKYRTKGYTSKGDKRLRGVVVKREVEVDIAPFIRKTGGGCSVEAIAYAKSIGLHLEKGYTIVKPHKRVYNKVKN